MRRGEPADRRRVAGPRLQLRAQRVRERLGRERPAEERGERGEADVVGGHARGQLGDDPARPARRAHDGDRRVVREVGGDLQAGDRVADDEDPPAREPRRPAVGAGVEDLDPVAEPQLRRDLRHGEAPGRGDDAVDPQRVDAARRDVLHVEGPALAVLAGRQDTRPEARPRGDAGARGVVAQLVADLLGGREHRPAVGGRAVGEARHHAAGVRPHAGPDAGVRGAGVPLAAEVVGGLEDLDREAALGELLGGRDAGGTAADDGDPCVVGESGGVHAGHRPSAARPRLLRGP